MAVPPQARIAVLVARPDRGVLVRGGLLEQVPAVHTDTHQAAEVFYPRFVLKGVPHLGGHAH